MKGMEGPPFTMMFLAVIAGAWFGGAGPGIVATLSAQPSAITCSSSHAARC